MFFFFCHFANCTFTARKRSASQLVKENHLNSNEKRFQNHLKTL